MLTLKQRAYAILACGPHSACCAFEGFGSGGWDQLPFAEGAIPGWKWGVPLQQSPGPLRAGSCREGGPLSIPHAQLAASFLEYTWAEAMNKHNCFACSALSWQTSSRDSSQARPACQHC